MAGGYTVRSVRAATIAQARRTAIEEAARDLAMVATWPTDEPLRWSIESLERGKPVHSVQVDTFEFYREESLHLSNELAILAKGLARNDLRLLVSDGRVAAVAESEETYTVEIADGEEWTVYAANWHHHYGDPEQAIACFRWLLTPYYRVGKETQNGELSAAWIERYESAGWRPFESMLFRNPTDPTPWMGGDWRREYRQQALLRPPQPYTKLFPETWLDENDMPRNSKLGVTTEFHPRSIALDQGWLEPDRLPES